MEYVRVIVHEIETDSGLEDDNRESLKIALFNNFKADTLSQMKREKKTQISTIGFNTFSVIVNLGAVYNDTSSIAQNKLVGLFLIALVFNSIAGFAAYMLTFKSVEKTILNARIKKLLINSNNRNIDFTVMSIKDLLEKDKERHKKKSKFKRHDK